MERTANTEIAHSVVRNKVHHLIEFCSFVRLVGTELPQPVQPCQLEELLGEEEPYSSLALLLYPIDRKLTSDEEGLRTEEG